MVELTLNLRTLGGFELSLGERTTPPPETRKARALIAFLAHKCGTDIARERLLEIFWPDACPQSARNSLKTALCSIRGCMRAVQLDPDSYLRASNSVVRLYTASVDAHEFERCASSIDSSDHARALRLYRGDFLEGDYDNWSVAERERLATLYESLLAHMVSSSKDPLLARRFIVRNPYFEDAYTALVEAALANRQLSHAAAWVQRCRRALAEIGEQPSPAFESRFKRYDIFTADRYKLTAAI